MARILAGLRRPIREKYDLWRLVDSRIWQDLGQSEGRLQIICDIDKTYLETEFETWVKMARIAFEDASDKITVDGASVVLRLVRWGLPGAVWDGEMRRDFPRPLHFVSSSPPQLRKVLEEKLKIDGLDWTSDTFKNQVYNIRQGRFDLIRNQVAYKTAAILKILGNAKEKSEFYMIGDNAESDPLVYLGIKLFIEGKLSLPAYQEFLRHAGVEDSVIADLFDGVAKTFSAQVKGIFIRRLAKRQVSIQSPVEQSILYFDSFFQAALLMINRGLLYHDMLPYLVRTFHNQQEHCLNDILANLRAYQSAFYKNAPPKEVEEVCKMLEPMERPHERQSKALDIYKEDLDQDLSEAQIIKFAQMWMQREE